MAENRGKTLYCGIDQSDTFTKAETWQAGKDRNERDDTVYFGENGNFRGFIAAQEGWLTDGESGITGQSIATIFEFPREKKKRRYKKVTVRRNVPADSSRLAYGPLAAQSGHEYSDEVSAKLSADTRYDLNTPDFDWAAVAQAHAAAYCVAQGYDRAAPEASTVAASEAWYHSPNLSTSQYQYKSGKARQYTATCEKRVRRRR